MKTTYYIELVTFEGIFRSDYSRVRWGDTEKKEIVAENLPEAQIKGLDIFLNHREKYLKLVDHRFSKEHRERLINTFPKEMLITEVIPHSIVVM